MLKDKNIVVGVTGGIAAYKAVDVVSRLIKKGANIDVIMTKSATKFVTPLTFQSLSQNFVTVDMFDEPKKWEVEHISLAQRADAFVLVPATANIIGKIANGIADDMLSTTVMATNSKVIFAPAMNTQMFRNPIFKQNMDKLKDLGYEFIKTDTGRLACGDIGEGKLAQPEIIVDYVEKSFKKDLKLKDKKVLITAGPTMQAIDPVRYITNHSSGKMGYSLAKSAKDKGANVTLISGPTNLKAPKGVDVINVKTTEEMFEAVNNHFKDCDILIKAAAPLDYRPEKVSKNKIKKKSSKLELKLVKNIDIAAHFGKLKEKQKIIGFAAETDNIVNNSKKKLKAKNFDMIIVNDVSKKDAGFKSNTNIVTIVDKNLNEESFPKMKKEELSEIIIDKVSKLN
ncbi:MAG: bifunctional phosphopantothenoylcysteine decarboxylase/phosphopantothenate--cysteine ligase CoaBC [Firmicutes bacterium]|nr:bifunctional phosphopantothenoylcysteine decarboxylase/phosphopantothenate--cysteine ligase CoaBC [Bacillota bacterium]